MGQISCSQIQIQQQHNKHNSEKTTKQKTKQERITNEWVFDFVVFVVSKKCWKACVDSMPASVYACSGRTVGVYLYGCVSVCCCDVTTHVRGQCCVKWWRKQLHPRNTYTLQCYATHKQYNGYTVNCYVIVVCGFFSVTFV